MTESSTSLLEASKRLAVQYTRVPKIRENMHRLLGIVNALAACPPIVKYQRVTPETIQKLNEETAICSGDWVCGPEESDVVAQALQKPRVKSEYVIKRIGGEMTVGHRQVEELA